MAVNFFLNNPWVGYAERSFDTMLQQITAKMQNPVTGIPEITDHSPSNPFIKRVSIWAGLIENIGYYADNAGREAFLLVARIKKSVINASRAYDYRVRGTIAATGEVTFTAAAPVASTYTIPAGTVLSTASGIRFATIANAVIATGTTTATVAVRQWTRVAASVVAQSNGQPDQRYQLTANAVHYSVVVLVNNVPYTAIDTLVEAKYNSAVFIHQLNPDGVLEIQFGDGVNGLIPPNGHNITVEYYESSGVAGNVGANTITVINSALPVGAQISVTNDTRMVNGTDVESIEQLRKLVPYSNRSRYRAVTDDDWVYVAELAPGVAKAGISYDCGRYVDVYIAPNGGGIASPTLITDTFNFLDRRKAILMFHRVNAAGQVIIEYQITVNALPGFYNSQVQANIIANLQAFHAVDNQEIRGSVTIGDIYQLIENTEGVRNSVVLMMRPIPYARPILNTFPALVWTRQQLATAADATYKLTFVSSSTFKLVRNNVYLGTFTVGNLVATIDLEFTVTGTYVLGNEYEFKTYLVAGSVSLTEPSLPTFDINYLTMTVTGGLL